MVITSRILPRKILQNLNFVKALGMFYCILTNTGYLQPLIYYFVVYM